MHHLALVWCHSDWRLALQDIKFNVHAHPTLSEVLDELFKQAHLEKLDRPDAKPAAAKKVPQEARV